MATLNYKKGDLYAKTQHVRDEAAAPEHLESAGDALIRDLAKKQTEKTTTLEEQLQIRQEFEKGSDIKPWSQSGLSSLKQFQNTLMSDCPSSSTASDKDIYDIETIKTRTGLSRHELELGLVEKPGSQSSALYRFALGNRKIHNDRMDLVSKLDGHPINRLKELEEEVFGEKKIAEDNVVEKEKKKKRRKRTRKKKKKNQDEDSKQEMEGEKPSEESDAEEEDPIEPEKKSYRPSLWDVKDMRKFCNNEQQGCQPRRLYTIRDGKIVPLDELPENG